MIRNAGESTGRFTLSNLLYVLAEQGGTTAQAEMERPQNDFVGGENESVYMELVSNSTPAGISVGESGREWIYGGIKTG